MAKHDVTAARLREVLSYEPETGVFRWAAPRRKCTTGTIAGCARPDRYVTIKVDYRRYYAHRLAWLYMTGQWPTDQVDHINCNKGDNRWVNLREATQKQNGENMPVRPTSASGVSGVTWSKTHNIWVARICDARRRILLGYFHDMNKAIECRRQAEVRLFTHSSACAQPREGRGVLSHKGDGPSAHAESSQNQPPPEIPQ